MTHKTISQMVQSRTTSKDSRKLRRRELFTRRAHSRNLREGPLHTETVALQAQIDRLQEQLRSKPLAPTLVRCKLSGQYFRCFDEAKQPRFGAIGTAITTSTDLERVLASRVGLTAELV